jgi:beta-lactam-binding protein with PASTA domain
MPDVFGMEAVDALAALRAAKVAVERVLDITGRELPAANLPETSQDALVIAADPPAGSVVALGERARLVLSATVREEPVVAMPSLVGLSLDEAKKVLGELGLVVGETHIIGGRNP